MSEVQLRAREMFERRIKKGQASGAALIDKVMREVPVDRIVHSTKIRFSDECSPFAVYLDGKPDLFSTNEWAEGQVCSRARMPKAYVNRLKEEPWGEELYVHNLNKIYGNTDSRYLIREYEGRMRGFLSDRYKRIDSRPLVEAFATACLNKGAVPIEGFASETKVGLSALKPKIYEPVPNEPITIGAHWENSDYGNGKHCVNGFVDRVWCSNGMIMSMGFAQVHLGKRLEDNFMLSDRTHQLDTLAITSAVSDIVNQSLSEEMAEVICATIKEANESEIEPEKALEALSKQLSKGETELIQKSFNSLDTVLLPPGNTVWRLSNAISWVAGNEVPDPDRKQEMLKLAGTVLTLKAIRRRKLGLR